MRLPRTWRGWQRLFWLTLRRCPVCHSPLLEDWALYDTGEDYCAPCGYAIWPRGFLGALYANARASHEAAVARLKEER